jgi:hypothetical protein
MATTTVTTTVATTVFPENALKALVGSEENDASDAAAGAASADAAGTDADGFVQVAAPVIQTCITEADASADTSPEFTAWLKKMGTNSICSFFVRGSCNGKCGRVHSRNIRLMRELTNNPRLKTRTCRHITDGKRCPMKGLCVAYHAGDHRRFTNWSSDDQLNVNHMEQVYVDNAGMHRGTLPHTQNGTPYEWRGWGQAPNGNGYYTGGPGFCLRGQGPPREG